MKTRPNVLFHERVVLAFDHPSGGSWTAPIAATGLITCVTNANMADTDYITIGDGLSAAKLYEYDKAGDGVTAGRVAWAVAGGAGGAADVAATLRTAILANQPGLSVTDNLDGTLTIAHKWPGAGGNVTITENVANAGFLVSGMSGGAAASQAVVADTTYKLWKAPRAGRIVSAKCINPTGLAEHADNHFDIQVLKGSTVMANRSSDSDGAGSNTFTADTFLDLTLSATPANLIFAADDIISLKLDEGGTASLPPGRIVVELLLL